MLDTTKLQTISPTLFFLCAGGGEIYPTVMSTHEHRSNHQEKVSPTGHMMQPRFLPVHLRHFAKVFFLVLFLFFMPQDPEREIDWEDGEAPGVLCQLRSPKLSSWYESASLVQSQHRN